jgi:hypothetical protein
VDPLSTLNAAGVGQGLSLRLTDGKGQSAIVATRPDEPALRFPAGEVKPDALFGQLFTGRVPLTALRAPITAFSGVDVSDIREVAILFDQTETGSLFLGDVEWVQSPFGELPGARQ